MTVARSKIVNLDATRIYHCISRCVRQASLIGSGGFPRQAWLRNRVKQMTEIFAISCLGFAIMDNHFHLVLRIDPDLAKGWSDEEVVRRWAKIYPPRENRKVIEVTDEWVAKMASDSKYVAKIRKRLMDLGWFMKEVKQEFSRMCNEEDGTAGAFFDGRYKVVAILDEQALLATMVYLDLNPLRAGKVKKPEESPHTSLWERLQNVAQTGRIDDLAAILNGSHAAVLASEGLEDALWLVPVEDRRRYGSQREGVLESFTLGNYLLLVDHVARQPREGKANMTADVADIFQRLSIKAEIWEHQLKALDQDRYWGHYLASSRARLTEVANMSNKRSCHNFNGCFVAKTNEAW